MVNKPTEVDYDRGIFSLAARQMLKWEDRESDPPMWASFFMLTIAHRAEVEGWKVTYPESSPNLLVLLRDDFILYRAVLTDYTDFYQRPFETGWLGAWLDSINHSTRTDVSAGVWRPRDWHRIFAELAGGKDICSSS